MSGRRPAALALLAGVALGAPAHAQAASFPLAISILLMHGTEPPGRGGAWSAHALAVALGTGVHILDTPWLRTPLGPDLTEALIWLTGCIFLLAAQKGRLRHPPALATGGAALAGLPPLVLMGQIGVAAALGALTGPHRQGDGQGLKR